VPVSSSHPPVVKLPSDDSNLGQALNALTDRRFRQSDCLADGHGLILANQPDIGKSESSCWGLDERTPLRLT
jgi:hypothetical protein